MKQVFWNLATNAFDAMPEGGQLTIYDRLPTDRCRQNARADVVEIAFQDTGEGIRNRHLDKIFLPFFTTKKRGSGLGLAAVHRIVDLHGGWIKVDSQEGKGRSLSYVCRGRQKPVCGCGMKAGNRGKDSSRR